MLTMHLPIKLVYLFVPVVMSSNGTAPDPCRVQEVSGFLQLVCSDNETLKCLYSDIYYTVEEKVLEERHRLTVGNFTIASALCKNDPHFYQACGMHAMGPGWSSVDTTFCGYYMCHARFLTFQDQSQSMLYNQVIPVPNLNRSTHLVDYCDTFSDCYNTQLDEAGCSSAGVFESLKGLKTDLSTTWWGLIKSLFA